MGANEWVGIIDAVGQGHAVAWSHYLLSESPAGGVQVPNFMYLGKHPCMKDVTPLYVVITMFCAHENVVAPVSQG
jgi:hypothetical protein